MAFTALAHQPRVLVVDDDKVARTLIATSLTNHRFSVTVAEDASSARKIVDALGVQSFDVLVTDFRMPGENGLSLTSWIQSHDSALTTIIVTAEGEKKLIAESLRSGVYDFHEKPLSIAQLVSSVSRAAQNTFRRRHLHAAEMAIHEVADLQQALVKMYPDALNDRLNVCYFPKQEAGGDFISIFPVGPKEFLLLATDVSGHDLRAAFVASYFQGIVHGMMERKARIEDVFEFFNDFLVRNWNRPENWRQGKAIETSIAACALHVDVEKESARVLNCGFPVPLLIGTDGSAELVKSESSSPLGWFASPEWTVATIKIGKGQSFALWSDGLEDLANSLGVDAHAVAFVLRENQRHAKPVPSFLSQARDDVMCVLLNGSAEVNQAGQSTCSLLLAQYPRGNTASQIDAYQEMWSRSLTFALPTLSESKLFDILLCTREAALNALEHGCSGKSDQEASIQFILSADQLELHVKISDPGPGHDRIFEHRKMHSGPELEPCHRGLLLIENLCDRLDVKARGAEMNLFFNVGDQPISTSPRS